MTIPMIWDTVISSPETPAGRKDQTMDNVEITVKMNHYTERPKSGRLYVSGLPEPEWPDARETPCVDETCESFRCRWVHGTWLINFLMTEGWREYTEDSPWRPAWVPEADHKAWNKVKRAALKVQRALILEALEDAKDQLPYVGGIRFSNKAGCSCGCSPGWIIDGAYNKTVQVTFG